MFVVFFHSIFYIHCFSKRNLEVGLEWQSADRANYDSNKVSRLSSENHGQSEGEQSLAIDQVIRDELGVTGFLSDQKEVADTILNIFPTPPQQQYSIHCCSRHTHKVGHHHLIPTQMTLSVCLVDSYPLQPANVSITKNRAILLTQSPPSQDTQLSQLGLRIIEPYRHSSPSLCRGQGYFSSVADEIILNIFRMMPKSVLIKCSCVCKRWKRLS